MVAFVSFSCSTNSLLDVSTEQLKTPQEVAVHDLKSFIQSSLTSKLDELKANLLAKLSTQEELMMNRIKKLEEEDDKDKKAKGVPLKKK